MAFLTALSGLNASQTSISVTSNNIANVGTIGFHGARAEFGDVYSNSLFSDARTQIGSGTRLNRVAQDFGQGSLATTSNSLDLALSGSGFFQLMTTGEGQERAYTRAGAFMLDAQGYVVNAAGAKLASFPTALNGTPLSINETQPLRIPTTRGEARATETVTMPTRVPTGAAGQGGQAAVPSAVAFDRADATSFAFSTPVSVLDDQGRSMNAEAFYVMTKAPDAADATTRYEMHLEIDGIAAVPTAAAEIAFDGDAVQIAGTTPMAFTVAGRSINLDLSGSELKGADFNVLNMRQDGGVPRGLTSVQIADDGVVWANYGGGDLVALGQVAVANFSNTQGLQSLGNASYAESRDSGPAVLGAPGEDGFGDLRSGVLEQANVNLTGELVNLITAQRNYQASAKALETESQLSQTIMNMRG